LFASLYQPFIKRFIQLDPVLVADADDICQNVSSGWFDGCQVNPMLRTIDWIRLMLFSPSICASVIVFILMHLLLLPDAHFVPVRRSF